MCIFFFKKTLSFILRHLGLSRSNLSLSTKERCGRSLRTSKVRKTSISLRRRKSTELVLLVSIVHVITARTVIFDRRRCDRTCQETTGVLATAPLRQPSHSVCTPRTRVGSTAHFARRTARITLRRMKLDACIAILCSTCNTELTPRNTGCWYSALYAVNFSTFLCCTQLQYGKYLCSSERRRFVVPLGERERVSCKRQKWVLVRVLWQ